MGIGAGWLNAGSFVLGLVAWALPVVYMTLLKGRDGAALLVGSVGACAVSLWMQLRYINHLVGKSDWIALLDTNDTMVKVAGFLLVSTLLLNALALFVRWRRGKSADK